MQSLSHWESEKVFVQKFLFEATFIFFFTLYLTIFHAKNLSSSNLFKKKSNKQKVSLVQCCKHFSSTKYSCHPSQILKKSFLQKAWKNDIMATTLI